MQAMLSLVNSRLASFLRNASLVTGLLLTPVLSSGQTFVQVNSNPIAASATSVAVAYTSAEAAGGLNVVVVSWNDTSSSIVSVTDTASNTYAPVGAATGHGLSQAIYYAKNIAAATPTVTVTFNTSASFPDVRVLEYSGLSTTAPLDNWAGNSGSSATPDSGAAATTGNDMILGAGTTANVFAGAGAGFTSRIITPFGNINEDSAAAVAAGSHNATATVIGSQLWLMQVVGFSTTAVTFPNAPVIDPTTPITPAAGADSGGTPVTISGTHFQPGAIVLFGAAPGIAALNCTETGGTTITCLTPSTVDGATDVTVVNVDGQSSIAAGAFTFQNATPTIATITPATGPTNGGTPVTIKGTNFQVGAKVVIGGLPAGDVVVQDNATITATTPGFPVGQADVTVTDSGGGTATKPNAYTTALGTGPINYIQRGGSASVASAASVQGFVANPQAAGNLNVVIIGWNDTAASVTAVTDTEGNTYTAALPVVTGTALRQVIYYAKNIVGDGVTPNTITVTFNQAAQFPDLQILEYSGLDVTSPLDAAAGAFGTGLLADTGACTTTSPVEVIVAGTTVSNDIVGSGSGFNLLIITGNGDASEHQITSVAGSCQATSVLDFSGNWVTQAISLKAAPAPAPDFSLSAAPTSNTVNAGSPGLYTITVTPTNGFTGAVALTCNPASLPAGAACAFTPSSVPGGAGTSALTITTSPTTPIVTSSVTVTGTSGSVSHTTPVGLTVSPAADFAVAATALSPASVLPGGAPALSTITVSSQNGFSSPVALTCTVSPVVNPSPTCGFTVTPVTPVANGSIVSGLTVTVPAMTTAQAYTITVTGTAGAVAHNAAVLHLTVTGTADFSVAAGAFSPATFAAGGSSTSTITIAPLSGFTGTVSLACSITPATTPAPTCAFNPTSVMNGTGTSVLTVHTTATTTSSLTPQSRGILFAMWLPVGGLALLGVGISPRRKKLLGLVLMCLMLSGIIFMAACGGSSSSGGGGGGTTHPGTPAGNYTVTVTATSTGPALSHTTTATFTVQ
jgi:IPT/TIG domain